MTAPFELYQPGYRFEASPRRVRAVLGDVVVADSQAMRLLYPPWGRPAAYYFPEQDVRKELLSRSGHADRHVDLGEVFHWDVTAGTKTAGTKTAARAARSYPKPPEALAELAGFVTFDWNAMDAWFEEDEQIFVHPRDPYHRVDVRESSRPIRVEVDGQMLAETQRPHILFETYHPVRYYVPRLDVRLDLLSASETRSGCAYKGFATYWSTTINRRQHEDVAWCYAFPFAECAKIADMICFYNERVDTYVDGTLQERPAARGPRPM